MKLTKCGLWSYLYEIKFLTENTYACVFATLFWVRVEKFNSNRRLVELLPYYLFLSTQKRLLQLKSLRSFQISVYFTE